MGEEEEIEVREDEPLNIEKKSGVFLTLTQVKKLYNAIEELNKKGIDEDVMIAFLSDKTHISKRTIKQVLKAQKEFFKKIGIST